MKWRCLYKKKHRRWDERRDRETERQRELQRQLRFNQTITGDGDDADDADEDDDNDARRVASRQRRRKSAQLCVRVRVENVQRSPKHNTSEFSISSQACVAVS